VPIVLFSGELTRLHSLDMMLSVVPKTLECNEHLLFVFACPTRLKEDILAREFAVRKIQDMGFSERVYFLGDIINFPNLLKACDIFVYPVSNMSRKIDTPLTVLEAMATELPIIISNVPPLNEILVDEAGLAIPKGDEESFAKAVLELAEDKNRRRMMGKVGRRIVKNNYNQQIMVKKYKELYEEFI
jgi:glycosyltransferase involved in cell wall biosynthesis